MKIIFSLSFLTLLITSCNQTPSNPPVTNEKPDTLTIKKDNLPIIKTPINLDSIEAANNASVLASGKQVTRASISREDSTIDLTANIRLDHRIFGYAKPDIKSERLLVFSVFTNDVENNPFGCKLGAYYDTRGAQTFRLKYQETQGSFIRALAIDSANNTTTLYFEKKWVVFE